MIPVAVILGALMLILVTLRFEREDRRYLVASFVAHVGACFAFLWFSAAWDRVKRGDIDGYCVSASGIATFVGDDPVRWIPELVKLIAHRESDFALLEISTVPATAAAHGWSGVAQIISGGSDSITAGCLVVAFFSFLSKALLYAVAKSAYGKHNRLILALATLFVPSVLFWTAGFVKEAYAMIGMSLAIYGIHRSFVLRRWITLPLALFGAAMTASVKPYVLFPIVLGAAAWVFARRRTGEIRVGYLLSALLVAFLGIALIGKVFPEFGIDVLNARVAGNRRASEMAGGGSLVGDESVDEDVSERSFASNLAALPLGLVNVLVRPFPFEVRSIPQAGAALENGTLLLVVAVLVRRRSMKEVIQRVVRTPPLFAAVVLAITFAAAVGLSSKNLGTLSRYRVPLMPAYVLAVLVLRERLEAATPSFPREARVGRHNTTSPRRSRPRSSTLRHSAR